MTWVLQDVTFASAEVLGAGPFGGVASGSFTYDAVGNIYSNVNITTTGTGIWGTDNCGDTVLCGPYVRATNFYAPSTALSLQVTPTLTDPAAGYAGYYGVSLQFMTALTNAGGTILMEKVCAKTLTVCPAELLASLPSGVFQGVLCLLCRSLQRHG
jgi:hypothetical protein